MKIGICSDLHLSTLCQLEPEFTSWRGDVLLVAGDIVESVSIDQEYTNHALEQMKEMAERVIVIPGNHEYYGSVMWEFDEKYAEKLFDMGIELLLGESTELKPGLNLYGGTLWTDFNNGDQKLMSLVNHYISDFRLTKFTDEKRFTPEHAAYLNKIERNRIEETIQTGVDWIIMTHFPPSWKSVSPRFQGDALNGYFVQDMDEFILSHPNIKYWVHGHVHDFFDYNLGGCNVICNPKGYRGERPSHLPPYKPFTIEV